ncbi:Tetratricopeptide repeat protein [Chryseobacterium sp. MOF25P]|uniref:tetratricopeptide repeat protein n=1 Tax=unclassified Chryseobacterium TaxID=2593645 RepID=UPI000805494D|nr:MULTISPECIES: tetratricopeptide repeat protein [unclassified Chryseobacterium]OBW43355.1 Tetratricopeptide repeat protein [Chryseobacterium sp. MOF25P]OBW46987.1 Tetratricopeptide repeat protein [Chryseobacterium sp. BGARF1]
MKKILIFVLLFIQFISFGQSKGSSEMNKQVSELIKLANANNETNAVKALNYLNEAFEYEKTADEQVKFNLYEAAGNIYFSQESYHLALKYYNKQLTLQDTESSLQKHIIYNNIGKVYWRLEDKKKAKEYWEKSLHELQQSTERKRSPESYIVFNNLAVLERSEKNYVKALKMLNEYANYSVKLKDTAGLVKAYQNIAINHIDLKEYDTAFDYFQRAKKLAYRAGLKNDLAGIYYNLGSFYIQINPNRDSAKFYNLAAFDLSNRYQFSFNKKKSLESLIELYEQENDFKTANRYLHQAKELSEKMGNDESAKKVSQLEQEHQQKMREKDLLVKQRKKDILNIVSIIVLILISVIALLSRSLQKNKLKRRIAENRLLAESLEEKNRLLTENAIQMLQTNEIIDSTQKDLLELKASANISTKKVISRIITDLKSGTKGFNKEEFEKLFKETHEDFYKNLLNKHPSLTRNEIRLCAFLKMTLSIKEISAITQQSNNSIVAARYRLRKKIGLAEGESLTNYLIRL